MPRTIPDSPAPFIWCPYDSTHLVIEGESLAPAWHVPTEPGPEVEWLCCTSEECGPPLAIAMAVPEAPVVVGLFAALLTVSLIALARRR